MRIVAVNDDRGIAPDGSKGASIHLRSLLNALQRAGNDVILHSRRGAKSEDGLDFEVIPSTEPDGIVDSIRNLGADFVLERYSLGAVTGLEAARETGRPFVLEVNAPLFTEASLHRPTTVTEDSRPCEERLWMEADMVLPVSRHLRDLVVSDRGHTNGVHVLPNGIDPALFAGIAAGNTIPGDLGFLGHPKPWHGLKLLPQVFEILKGQGKDVRLVVIGGGPGAEQLQQDFDALGLGNMVEITGPLEQKAALERLSRCGLSLAPYDASDAFYFCPLKVLESLALGVPLASTDTGDIRELTGGFALCSKPGDVEDFSQSIISLLDNPLKAGQMARKGQAHVLRHHTWDLNAAFVVEKVRELLKENRQP